MTTYTRAYSANCPRRLASGKGPGGRPLTRGAPPKSMDDIMELLYEFQNHAYQDREEPTALVSVSTRNIDTLNRAFCLHLVNGEHPSDIWIAFIEVSAAASATSATVHPAKPLAEAIDHENPPAFQYESVFEWAIPEECVLHEVRLQTLIDRGLRYGDLLGPELQYVNTHEMRRNIASVLNSTCTKYGSWEIGVYLGGFAQKFGANAPSDWIAHQLFHDCVSTRIVCDGVIIRDVRGCSAFVDFDFFSEMDEGIDTALVDWWLADYDFFVDLHEFRDWQDEIEERMAWDLIDFRETWIDGIEPDIESDGQLRDEAYNALSAKHEEFRADIEARAVDSCIFSHRN